MREQDFKVICTEPYAYCKMIEDNTEALELARFPKLHPRTKHVRKGLIKIIPINTKDPIADAHTKALAQNDF
jgi:hypothetical protein